MRSRWFPAFALCAASSSVFAGGTSLNLDFSGSGNTLAATGFENVYNLDPTGFNVTGGNLVMMTLPSDDFGNYENDPDTAKNHFYSEMQPGVRTVVESRVRYENLNVNFHGGGVWFGTDQDHRVRLGLVNNSFKGGVSVESLRENEDLWPGAPTPGPGNDIQGARVPDIATSPQTTPIDVVWRLIRDGTGAGPGGAGASMFYSLDNGATFSRVGGAGFTFDHVVTGPGQGFGGGPSIEGAWKVGVWAFGGPDGQIPATLSFDNFTANSGDTAWANDADGNWETWTAWTLGVPSAVEATANLIGPITANRTVTITDPAGHNLGTLNLSAGAGIGYTIANTGTAGLRFTRFGGGQALISVAGGDIHEITAPVTYATNTTWNIGDDGRLRLTGASTFEGTSALTKAGPGLVETRAVHAAGLTVNFGVVRVLPNGTSASTSRVGALNVSEGQFDITNNAVVIPYETPTPSPIASIRTQIASAFNGGSWNGNGITSSQANNTTHAVGYGEAAALATVPAIFGTVTGDAVLIRFTRYGDANLDGTVNLQDFNRLAASFGATNAFWHQGDFNYDGNVNLQDFNRLAANFGQNVAGTSVTPQDWANLASAIPEPTTAVFALVPMLMLRRTRRCR